MNLIELLMHGDSECKPRIPDDHYSPRCFPEYDRSSFENQASDDRARGHIRGN